MKYLIIALVLLSFNVSSAELAEKETKELAQNFMELIGSEKFKGAYAKLKPHWPLPPHEIDTLIYQSEMQRSQIIQRLGKPIGIEYVKVQTLGESYIRYLYLEKFEKHAISWLITFYKPNDNWIVNQVVFNPQVDFLY